MKDIETRLRAGMTKKGLDTATQDAVVLSITSFAMYGFPESHAASFALLAYASAYLKCHYLAAFTAAMLNNQPMGFYSASTLVKDAQRHGLHFLPVDVTVSDWPCTVVEREGEMAVRLGLNYVKGLSRETGMALLAARSVASFADIDDLRRRVAGLSKREMNMLADLGALNFIGRQEQRRHRRDALWQSELVFRPVGELLADAVLPEMPSPLQPMNGMERLKADFANSGLSIGAHPMRFHRKTLDEMRVATAEQVKQMRDGCWVRVAGAVICRQRPPTAKGFAFLSLEDETGTANIILKPQVFERLRATVMGHAYLLVEGVLQNQSGVACVKAQMILPCPGAGAVEVETHDFH